MQHIKFHAPHVAFVRVAKQLRGNTGCEFHGMTHFQQAEGHSVAKIHCQLYLEYGDNIINDNSMRLVQKTQGLAHR